MKSILFAIVVSLGGVGFISAQDSYEAGPEDVVVLSPFEVSKQGDENYVQGSSMSGARIATPVVDGMSSSPPMVPITLVKRADAVVAHFMLSNTADKQEARNRELYSAVELIAAEVGATPGFRLEQREVRFAGGNRKMSFITKSGSTTSFANLVIFAEMKDGVRLVDRVKQIRDLIEKVKLPGSVKTVDGTVGLYLKNVNQYRREILSKVFEDLDFVKKGLGPEMEVQATGLDKRIRMRVCSETEIELWIDYGFAIRSVRELSQKKE